MNILLFGPIARIGAEQLRRHFGTDMTIAEADGSDDPQALAVRFAEADVLVSVGYHRGLPATPRLRLIHVPASGLDEVDFAAVPHGVPVCNAFEHDTGIGEYVLAAMLHFTVGLAPRDARFRAGSWVDSPRRGAPGRPELAGRTVGCIGYGSIGRAVARRARACGMNVMAITRTPRALEPAPDWLGGMAELPELLADADFLVVACPLTEGTRGLIDGQALARMKPEAVLINVARGPIVEESALYEALRDRRIAGAAIDVWWAYPEPGGPEVPPAAHPFHELDNLVMTPHCSGWTEGVMPRRFTVIIDNLERLRTGRPLRHQVHPKAV
jgi:phosphoglycerate dehydrogenase-like enzyme